MVAPTPQDIVRALQGLPPVIPNMDATPLNANAAAGLRPAPQMAENTPGSRPQVLDPFAGVPLHTTPSSLLNPVAGTTPGLLNPVGAGIAPKIAPQAKPAETERVSTRLPTGVRATENPMSVPRLTVDVEAMKRDPELFEKNVNLVRSYPNLSEAERTGPADTVAQNFINHVKDNLLFLHDSVPPEIAQRSSQWYDGARRIVDDISKHYGTDPRSTASVIATQSPQKDWFQNVNLGERIHEIVFRHQNTPWSSEMEKTAQRILEPPAYKVAMDRLAGRRFGDLNDPIDKATWLRLYDESFHPKSFRTITPEGDFGGPVLTQKGQENKIAWGSFPTIVKGIQSLESNGDVSKISSLLGEMHKVRNFYNNMIDPNSPHGDVTMDTHAVAAALLRPLSVSTTEVAHNFKNTPPPGVPGASGSAITGIQGTYPLYADAYRQAAAERGILPRKMQSITWEAIRGLFPRELKKGSMVDRIDAIWRDYQNGNISKADAQQRVIESAGGIRNPSWWQQ